MRYALLLLLMTSFLVPAAEPPARWFAERAQQRQERATFTATAAKDRVAKAKAAKAVVDKLLLDPKISEAPRAELTALVDAIATIDPATVAPLQAQVQALPASGAATDPKVVEAWKKRLASARTTICRPLESFGFQAVECGAFDIAHQTLLQVLAVEPMHANLHRNLGLTWVDGRWYGPRDMEMVTAGGRWNDEMGWVQAGQEARYAKGDYFDLGSKAWTTLEAANRRHAVWTDPWVLKTEHLELTGTTDLKELVLVANRLEAFYAQIFASYTNFFVSDHRDARIIFGLKPHPRLNVQLARDIEDYRISLPKGIDAGWSAGMYLPHLAKSCFFAGPMGVMYHEFTHQILDQFNGGGGPPAWLVEGIAVYTEAPRFIDGRLVLGDLKENDMIQSYFKDPSQRLPLSKLLAITSNATWSATTNPGPQYATAGALLHFALEADQRARRADTIDYLRDAYQGMAREKQLWHYWGIAREELEKRFITWTETTKP